MLVKAARLLRKNGFLCIVLPKACVENSRYFDASLLSRMLEYVGFTIVDTHASSKLFFLTAAFQGDSMASVVVKGTAAGKTDADVVLVSQFPKQRLRGGKTCNNFHMIL